ncbi:MAG: TetR/AcrR family transcriptional regulator [SAR324 cluster bacterium]|nr:TetR/AcrR family transcriptional regulator [SAR324 cluster bacterium]
MKCPIKKRARGTEQKRERLEQIIAAASLLLEKHDFGQISMQSVAKEAGIVKGTLYLYFKTKEELFLELETRELSQFFKLIKEGLAGVCGSDQLPDLLVSILEQRNLLLKLMAIANQVLEQNISFEKAKDFKLGVYDAFKEVVPIVMEKCPDLKEEQIYSFLVHFISQAIGLWNHSNPAPIIKELYQEVPELGAMQINFADSLKKSARWLLEGVKQEI